MTCAHCRRDGDCRPVPRWLRLAASTALGFAHAGMWANEALRKPLCASCRRSVMLLALAVSAAALAAVVLGVRALSSIRTS